jgi:hypothetical protein
MAKIDFAKIWQRIIDYQGDVFIQIKGGRFSYKIIGNQIMLNSTNQNIPKSEVEKAIEFVPLANTVPLQQFRAPSYLYAILMDKRIRQDYW